MTAVLLALASAAFFGAMTVATRLGIAGEDAAAGALATVLWALLVTLVASAVRFDLHGAWPFLLTGMLSPGISQVLFTLAVREVGASRTSVTVGSAPLVAGGIALVFLGEPLRVPLLLGALAIVAGGLLLAAERRRPSHLRARGLLFAALATVAFATRDALIRALHGHASPEVAGAATLLSGALVASVWARRPPGRVVAMRMAPAGLLFGLSYVCIFEAYFRGRVTVVSPLVATESLWGVGLSALVFSKEAVGRRLLLGAASVVIGGVVIGSFR
jgi:uncharacterized membrane protein